MESNQKKWQCNCQRADCAVMCRKRHLKSKSRIGVSNLTRVEANGLWVLHLMWIAEFSIICTTTALFLFVSILCYKFTKTSHKATNSPGIFTKMLQTLRPHNMIQEITNDPIISASTRQLDIHDASKRVKQPYEVLLVLDVEATCLE